jgi:tetratricopeptide (TPR) repeat protein
MSPIRDPNKKGIALMKKGQYEMAIEEFQRVLVKDPRNWETYAYLGDIYRILGNNDEAISYYNDSIYHNPEAVESYEGLAIAYADKGIKFDEAIAILEETREIMKGDASALKLTKVFYLESLSWVYFQRGNAEKAIEYFKEAYPIWKKDIKMGVDELEPAFSEEHYHFGMLLFITDETGKAREEFEKAIKCRPNSIFAKQAREELNKITPILTPSLARHPDPSETYYPEKKEVRRKKHISSLLLEALTILAYLAFIIVWFGYELFSDDIQKFYDYLEARYPLQVIFIGTFLSGAFLFWRIIKTKNQKRKGMFEDMFNSLLACLGVAVFICFLLIIIFRFI